MRDIEPAPSYYRRKAISTGQGGVIEDTATALIKADEETKTHPQKRAATDFEEDVPNKKKSASPGITKTSSVGQSLPNQGDFPMPTMKRVESQLEISNNHTDGAYGPNDAESQLAAATEALAEGPDDNLEVEEEKKLYLSVSIGERTFTSVTLR
ncbi:MAG: hypothetical protein Q9171_006702 [Xanthocarpia ochracea]